MGTAAVVGGVTVLALGLLFPPKVKTPTKKTGEVADQKSKEGEPQPFIYGIARPIGGNVIYQSEPIKVIKKEKVSGGGKGGSKKQTQKVEYIYRYYALRVCRGPGIEYRRIWRNGKLAYDASTTDKEQLNNNKLFLKQAKLYSGSWDQLPDPVLEGRLGVGNVPAYRGLAYMVIEYEDLTNVSGAIPQYVFEVARAPSGYTLTSKLYPCINSENITINNYKIEALLKNKTRKVAYTDKIEIKKYGTYPKNTGKYKPENDFSVSNFIYQVDASLRAKTKKLKMESLAIGCFNYAISAKFENKSLKIKSKNEAVSNFNFNASASLKNKKVNLKIQPEEIKIIDYKISAYFKKG